VKLILGTFFFSVASALVPILNAEAYLAVVAAKLQNVSAVELAAVGGAGQIVGKIIWYYAGYHSLKFKWMQKKMETPKWKNSYEKWSARIAGRPMVGAGICFASAVTGFPPLAIVAVLAGSLRLNFVMFAITCFVGRTIRFWIVLAGVDWLKHLFPGLFGH
jgi:membrane protein YqaA with SNARE-associated domain